MNANRPQPDPSTSDAPVEERLAKLTGFNNQSASPNSSSNTSMPSPTATPLLSDEDLEEQITRHSFASSPLSKLVFVAGAVFVAVFLASLFLAQFQSPGESVSAKKPNEKEDGEQSPLLSADERDREKAQLLSELALREQLEHLRALETKKVKKPEPVKTKQPVKPAARSVVRRKPPTARPQTVPVRSGAPARPVAPAPQPDPAQLWVQLSQVGSFGGVSSVSSFSNSGSKQSVPSYEPKSAVSKLVSNDSLSNNIAPPEPSPIRGSDFHFVPFGQSVSAVLETTIAWEGSRGSRRAQLPDDRYPIALKEALKDRFGNPKIPAGSQLVVRLEGRSQALVNLTAESIIVNGVETKLPQGALKIRSMGNQPLIAQVTTVGGDQGIDSAAALADVLSIAGDFADLPGSRSISTLYRTLSGETTRRRTGTTINVFFLREGTTVEVFVNKTFSLDVEEKPLELDLGGIQLEPEVTQPLTEEWELSPEVSVAFESTKMERED